MGVFLLLKVVSLTGQHVKEILEIARHIVKDYALLLISNVLVLVILVGMVNGVKVNVINRGIVQRIAPVEIYHQIAFRMDVSLDGGERDVINLALRIVLRQKTVMINFMGGVFILIQSLGVRRAGGVLIAHLPVSPLIVPVVTQPMENVWDVK